MELIPIYAAVQGLAKELHAQNQSRYRITRLYMERQKDQAVKFLRI